MKPETTEQRIRRIWAEEGGPEIESVRIDLDVAYVESEVGGWFKYRGLKCIGTDAHIRVRCIDAIRDMRQSGLDATRPPVPTDNWLALPAGDADDNRGANTMCVDPNGAPWELLPGGVAESDRRRFSERIEVAMREHETVTVGELADFPTRLDPMDTKVYDELISRMIDTITPNPDDRIRIGFLETPESLTKCIRSGHAPHQHAARSGANWVDLVELHDRCGGAWHHEMNRPCRCMLCQIPRNDGWGEVELERRIQRMGDAAHAAVMAVALVSTGARTWRDG